MPAVTCLPSALDTTTMGDSPASTAATVLLAEHVCPTEEKTKVTPLL